MPRKGGGIRLPKIKKPPMISQPLGRGSPIKEPEVLPPYGYPPPTWPGTEAEWAVNWALTKLKVLFYFQFPVSGGRTQFGGSVADFYLPEYHTALYVMGVYWHYERGVESLNADKLTKMILEGYGYSVIWIDEDDALKNPTYYVQEAMRGKDHSRGMSGV